MYKKSLYLIVCLACMLSIQAWGDNAPVTKAGIILNAPLGPATTTVPITVSNFIDIGSVNLTLDYSSSILTYVSFTPDPAFTGMTVTVTTPGRLVVNWPAAGTGITLPDQTVLLSLTFTYNTTGAKSALTWFDNGSSCQYTKYSGGAYTALNDSPTASYYQNGVVTNHPAPVTIAPIIINAVPGTVSVPIKVAGFTNIGSITLKLEYDPNVLTYLGFIQNPLISGSFNVGNNPGSGGKYTIDMLWFGTGFALADSSVLITLSFTYANTVNNGNYSDLTWLDNGPSCQYSDGQFHTLYDAPTSAFYKNGLVASRVAPKVSLPSLASSTPGTGVSLPVMVTGFTNIKSFTISFEYDPLIMTYNTFTPNAAFGGTLTVVNNAPGGNGKSKLVMSWTGASVLTLSDGSAIATLDYSYISGTTNLAWVTGDGTSCRYNDIQGNACYDFPKTTYYIDGLVASQVAPKTFAKHVYGTAGQQVTVPIRMTSFSNIGQFALTLDYDPGVITWQSATLVPSIGGTFTSSASGLGRILLGWSGSPATLADTATLVNLTFMYNGGDSQLAWFDNGSSCQYTSGLPQVLYDWPQATYYINGEVSAGTLSANFSANTLTPLVNQTVTFTDISLGSPLTWAWSFSPSTVTYVGGTSASSQNPQVQFTVNGIYSVTLTVTNLTGSSSVTRTDYLHVGTPGLWTGISSTFWYNPSNWHNYVIPTAATDVTIPTSAPYWPVFTGTLTLGNDCRSITLNGSGEMIVEGSITLNPGARLEFTGSGRMQIVQDWTNGGLFRCGTGTVEFTSPVESLITGGLNPQTSVTNFYRETFSSVMVPLTASTAGPIADNTHTDVNIGFTFNYLGVDYTQVRINSNGWLSLNLSGDDPSADNANLFTTSNPNTSLSPWWDDLKVLGFTAITYKTTGSAPDRVFTAEWKEIVSYKSGASTRLSFQAILYETTNVIEFVYGTPVVGTHNAFEGASIGIEDATGGSGHFMEATTGSTANPVTNLSSATAWPSVNYRFTPPPKYNTFYHLKVLKGSLNKLTNPGGNNIIVNGNLIIN